MKKIYKPHAGFLLAVIFLAVEALNLNGQSSMPDILLKNSLRDQLNYLDEHTKIYENYRAIREDMFQKVKQNIFDSLALGYSGRNQLSATISKLNHRIDTLGSDLGATRERLEETTRTKNSIRLLGIEVNKLTYNSIMWLIVLGLAMLLVIGLLVFKRNLSASLSLKKELGDLKDEFQAYRKSTREAREKMSMDHFNEIKRLKGG